MRLRDTPNVLHTHTQDGHGDGAGDVSGQNRRVRRMRNARNAQNYARWRPPRKKNINTGNAPWRELAATQQRAADHRSQRKQRSDTEAAIGAPAMRRRLPQAAEHRLCESGREHHFPRARNHETRRTETRILRRHPLPSCCSTGRGGSCAVESDAQRAQAAENSR